MDQGNRIVIRIPVNCDGATVEMTASVRATLAIMTVGDKSNKKMRGGCVEEKRWMRKGSVENLLE